MTTPIYDFLYRYKKSGVSRFHMPGHKGVSLLGTEGLDITEITGADVLYHAEGIIAESEANATELFGTAHTYYSTEGSTLAIKAMLAIITRKCNTGATILAARNVHKAFVYAAGELGLSVEWMYPEAMEHLCKCNITSDTVAASIDAARASGKSPAAVYITTPDYLGDMLDVKAIAEVCRSAKIPLLVDNAHGAYLRFLEPSLHPMQLGAAMCADSAHKTLPVLTGGAYLHIAKGYEEYTEGAREALAMFASTSPSYLTLASLDLCNAYLGGKARAEMEICKQEVSYIKTVLAEPGQYEGCAEPMKIRIDAARYLNTGWGIAEILRKNRIECEFTDDEYVVLMASPKNTRRDFKRLERAIGDVAKEHDARQNAKNATRGGAYDRNNGGDGASHAPHRPTGVMSIRDALLSPSEIIPVEKASGRICASPTVSCPPAIPVVISGEVIDEQAISLFKRYGINTVSVVKEKQ